MKNRNKRDLILDAMQELMSTSSVQTISVSDIAQKAGIGKGSIYYYFNSKNDMIEAVIERSYFRVLDEGQALVDSQDMGAFEKMEIIYRACLDSSLELKRQEALNTFNEQQQSALIHQKFVGIIITRLEPILTDIIRQGIAEGKIRCEFPEETARIILTILTVTLDNSLAPISQEKITKVLTGFAWMLEESQDIPENTLQFLLGKKLDQS